MSRTVESAYGEIPAPPDTTAWRHWGDGYAGRLSATRPQGYSSSDLAYFDIAVNSSGQLVVQLAADPTIDIGVVDQGAAGSSAWKVDGSAVTQPVSATSLPLPTGAATDATLTDGTQRVGGTVTVSGAVTASWASAQHVIVDTAPTTAVTGTFFQATQPVSGTFFQATQPVSLASMPSTPVTGTFWQATQPVSGSLGRTWTLSSGTDSVNVGNFPATQAVSLATNTPDVTDRAARLLGTVANTGFNATGTDGITAGIAVTVKTYNGANVVFVRDPNLAGLLSEILMELRLANSLEEVYS